MTEVTAALFCEDDWISDSITDGGIDANGQEEWTSGKMDETNILIVNVNRRCFDRLSYSRDRNDPKRTMVKQSQS